jgi:hypothetical protein
VAAIETLTRRVSLAGRVTDAETGLAIGGAVATISAAPREWLGWLAIRKTELASHGVPAAGMPDVAVTTRDGWFHFADLPDGKYALDVAVPAAGTRYAAARVSARVKRGSGPPAPADASAALVPTLVRGRVTDAGGAPVPMAEVRIQGSGEKTWADADGRYRLVAIERGARRVQVTARGMAPAEAVAQLPDPGSAATVEFALKPGS